MWDVMREEEAMSREFSEGYCRLADPQVRNGFAVKHRLPGLRGPAVEKLYAEGKAWLAGESAGDPA